MEFRPEEAVKAPEEIELNSEEIAAVKAVVAAKVAKSGPRYISLQAFLTVCLVLALVGGTFAWYSKNRQVQDGATMLQSDPIEFAMSEFNVYKKPILIEDGVVMTVNDQVVPLDAIDLGADTIELNPYDSVFDRNEYTPIYIKIKTGGASLKAGKKLVIYLNAKGPVSTVTSPSAVEYFYYPGSGSIDTNVSNIVKVQWASGIINGDFVVDSLSQTPDEIYTALNSSTSGITWQEPYTYLVPAGYGRNTTVVSGTSIENPGFGPGASVQTDDGVYKQLCVEISDFQLVGNETMLLLKIDYDSKLVQAYLNSRKQSNAARLGSTEVIDFTGDMTLIRVECLNSN